MKLFQWVALVMVSACPALATVVPSEDSHVQSLDGTWQFKIEQQGEMAQHASINAKAKPIVLPAHFEPFEQLDYHEDASWKTLKVPGNWEMYGFTPSTYGQPDNAIGIYRQWIKIPASWRGRQVKINFDGVQNGAEIYLNGQPVNVSEPAWGKANYHEGGFDAFQVDLTPAVKFGEKNLLAIRVYKNTKSVEMDTGDFYFLGGIHRKVTMFSVPAAHIEDYIVRTKLLDGGKAEVRVIVKLSDAMPSGQVTMQLKGESPVQSVISGQSQIEIAQTLDNPRLWSAEKPNLYEMSLDLKDGDGKTIEQVKKKIGVREIEIKNGVFMVNNVPVKLEGMCRHDVYPTMGSAVDETLWRKDISLMKAANVNAIRTSHYPYGSGFYDLCDEMGMYVADEMAACWVPTNTQELEPMFAQHARETVARDKNHPCVILWAVGNENKIGVNDGVSAKIMHDMDPTRPRLVSTHDSNGLEDNVEFDDRHYPQLAEITKLAGMTERREKFPLILLENPNVWDVRNGADYGNLDLWGEMMKRDWEPIWRDSHIPGSFLWEWQDRAISEQGPYHPYTWDAKVGIDLAKVKGIVDGWRNPRADYYHVKMVYAPIVVDAKASVDGSAVTLNMENRYSFTDVSELKTTWKLLAGDKELKSGKADLTLAPLTKKQVRLDLPSEDLQRADALQIAFDSADGNNVATYQVALKNLPRPQEALQMPEASIHFPQLNLVATVLKDDSAGWRSAIRYRAHLENISVQPAGGVANNNCTEADLYGMALDRVRSVDADVVMPAADANAALQQNTKPKNAKGKRRRKKPAALAPSGNVAHVHVDVMGEKFAYTITWSAGDADIQELGWAFEMPRQYDHFSWNRQSLWTWYPATHVGRPAGTATPASANQDIGRISRPDAFDFNSSKYYCNFARLTDGSGNGIGLNFAAEDRQDCRGDFADNGYKLVVNKYCSPPRDLSSGIVPDLYFTIKNGVSVNGGFSVGSVDGK
ncbi:MAG TPA: glycoside hydrolase family 2 TIM barrel-domain containing protein [Tepidisphaeraceae bacterium]|jgi:beta-galactosidase/beta-glucuronidase